MPRKSRRVVIPNCPHHITQRGNNRREIFFAESDREVYLNLLRGYTAQYKIDLLGYCLMTNHVHLIAVPTTREGLAKALGRTHNDYARWLNIRRRESGHLWQNRYFSCPVEARYLWAVLAYIERNPVRAQLAERCEQWAWSSARAHLGGRSDGEWLNQEAWAQNWTPALWAVALEDGLAEAEISARLREATQTGRPIGEDTFIARCEADSQIALRRQRPGPKPKTMTAAPQFEMIASSQIAQLW